MPISLSDRAAIIARMDSQFNSDIQLRRDLVKMEKRAKDVVTNCRLYQKVNFWNFQQIQCFSIVGVSLYFQIYKSTGDSIFIFLSDNFTEFIWHHLYFKKGHKLRIYVKS